MAAADDALLKDKASITESAGLFRGSREGPGEDGPERKDSSKNPRHAAAPAATVTTGATDSATSPETAGA